MDLVGYASKDLDSRRLRRDIQFIRVEQELFQSVVPNLPTLAVLIFGVETSIWMGDERFASTA